MARGIFYKCDHCDKVEFVEIYGDDHTEDYIFCKYNKLPDGWFKITVPYFEEGAYWDKVVHLCSLECSMAYLKMEKEADDLEQFRVL